MQNDIIRNNKGAAMKRYITVIMSIFILSTFLTTGNCAETKKMFFDGNDWTAIDKLAQEPKTRMMIKAYILRAVYESSAFTGKPLVSTKNGIINYLPNLDTFYRYPENRSIPLFYAIRFVEQIFLGVPDAALEVNRKRLIERLKANGVIRETPSVVAGEKQ